MEKSVTLSLPAFPLPPGAELLPPPESEAGAAACGTSKPTTGVGPAPPRSASGLAACAAAESGRWYGGIAGEPEIGDARGEGSGEAERELEERGSGHASPLAEAAAICGEGGVAAAASGTPHAAGSAAGDTESAGPDAAKPLCTILAKEGAWRAACFASHF